MFSFQFTALEEEQVVGKRNSGSIQRSFQLCANSGNNLSLIKDFFFVTN